MRYQGPYIWNNLPLHIKFMHSISSFKMPLSSISLINIDFSPLVFCSFKNIFLFIFPYCYHEIYCQQIYRWVVEF